MRPGFDPWVKKIPWRRNGYPLQYSFLENSMDREACGLQSMGSYRVGSNWAMNTFTFFLSWPCLWHFTKSVFLPQLTFLCALCDQYWTDSLSVQCQIMINCTLESIRIYISGSSYYTNKHLLNSRWFVVSDGGMLTCCEIWGLFVWNQCHFPGCCQPISAYRDILCPWPSPLALQLSGFPLPALAAPPQLLFWASLLPPVLPWGGRFCQRLFPPPLNALLSVLAHSQGPSHHSPAIPKSTSLTSWACEISSCGLCMAKPRTCPSPVLLDHHQLCSRSDLVSDQGLPILPSKYSSDSSWLPAASLLPSCLSSFKPWVLGSNSLQKSHHLGSL